MQTKDKITVRFRQLLPERVPMKGKSYQRLIKFASTGDLMKLEQSLYRSAEPIWRELHKRKLAVK